MAAKTRMVARGALCAAAVWLCIAPAVRADVTLGIPDDLCSDSTGQVTVLLQLTNDQPVRAIFAQIVSLSGDIDVVADSPSCTARTPGFSCEANAVAGTGGASGHVDLIVVSTGGDAISAGQGSIMSLGLRLTNGACGSSGDNVVLSVRGPVVADPTNHPITAQTENGLAACSCQLAVADAKQVAVCQPTVSGGARSLVVKRLQVLSKCGTALFTCAQRKPGDAGCVAKAKAKCSKDLAKLDAKTQKFVATVEKGCSQVGQATVLSARGLDFEQIADQCSLDFGGSVASIADIATCLAAQHACRAEELITSAIPRVRELADQAQLSLGSDTCLGALSRAGSPSTGADADAKPLVACQSAIANAGGRYVSTALSHLDGCVGKVLRCLQLKPGDARCMAKAEAQCTKQIGVVLPALAQKLEKGIGKGCALPFATLAADTGIGLGSLGALCQTVGVDALDSVTDYQTCLARQHECLVRDLLQFGTPRAGEVLRLVGDTPPSYCQ